MKVTQHDIYATLVAAVWYTKHAPFSYHISLQKFRASSGPEVASPKYGGSWDCQQPYGVLWHRLIHLAPLHCGKMLCISGGVRGDGCRKAQGLSEKRGDNLGLLGPCHTTPPGMMASAGGTCCEGTRWLRAQGREGDVSTALLASLMSPLYPSLERMQHPARSI